MKNRVPPYACCADCGEHRRTVLRPVAGTVLCGNCADTTHPRGTCALCLTWAPVEGHHIYGRGQPGPCVALCLNCHRLENRLREAQDVIWRQLGPPLRRPGIQRLQGWTNLFVLAVRQVALTLLGGQPLGILPASVVGPVLLLGLLAAVSPETMAGLCDSFVAGTVVAIGQELGASPHDWERVVWPDGLIWRAVGRACRGYAARGG